MTREEKIQKVLDLLSEISEMYPEIEKVMLDNVENPSYIILTTTEHLNKMGEFVGMEPGEAEQEYPTIPNKKKRNMQ